MARRGLVIAAAVVVVLATSSTGHADSPPTLYLPFATNATWWANGPHSGDGATGTRNNVDLGPGNGADATVLAAAAGTAHVFTCSGGYYVRVDHGGGWTTQYWHLGSVAPGLDGSSVSAGTYIGTSAIVCGNPTTFSHVHFGLYLNGVAYALDGVSIGGYTIHAGSGQYNGCTRQQTKTQPAALRMINSPRALEQSQTEPL